MFSRCHVIFHEKMWWRNYVSYWSWISRCSIKKVLWKILRNSQENNCARASFLIKLQTSGCEFRENCNNTIFYIRTTASEFCTEFLRKYAKNEILRNTTVQIDSSSSSFNDFEVFLLYLEIVLYFWIDLYLEIALL